MNKPGGSPTNLPSEERQDAEWRSKDCPVCYGGGLVVVFHRDWRGSRDGTRVVPKWDYDLTTGEATEKQATERFPAEVAAHCSCPIGVWMRGHLPVALQRQIPRVDEILDGRSDWLLEPPGDAPPAPTFHRRSPRMHDVKDELRKPQRPGTLQDASETRDGESIRQH